MSKQEKNKKTKILTIKQIQENEQDKEQNIKEKQIKKQVTTQQEEKQVIKREKQVQKEIGQQKRQQAKEVLKIENVSKKYQAPNGEIEALKEIDFTLKEGEFLSIIGPSGCGKSTILSIVAGLETKDKGEIKIDGKIGYMLQKDSLLEWRTIYNNIMFGLEVQKNRTKENEEYAIQLLKKYNLYEFKDKYPNQLSGGMRQRVALIRTLAIKPKILLLDEAFSALDYQTRIMVTKDIYDILKNEHISALIVTHDISEAISMSDRIVILSNRPAQVKEIMKIEFEIENRDPINCRESPKFSEYFDAVWKGLNIYE